MRSLPAVVMIITLLACGGDAGPTATPSHTPVGLSISATTLSLIVGDEARLTARAYDSSGRTVSAAFEWSSANPVIATVGNSDGTVTAISAGTTTVTVTAGPLRSTATVSVALIAQWAIGATASSEYTSGEWSAMRATGPSDVVGCVDDPNAWASLTADGVDTLELTYAQSVLPSEIRIHENYGAGSIVKVEVKDVSGKYHTVYTALPIAPKPCPGILTIAVTTVTINVSAVRVTVDQRVLSDWNEIDAVRLIGYR